MPISRPFSLTDVSVTCSFRRIARRASRLSATRSPTTISFNLLRPLKTKVGMACKLQSGLSVWHVWSTTNRSGLSIRTRMRLLSIGRVQSGAPIDQLAQLIHVRRTLHGGIQTDLAFVVERRQSLIERLHPVFVL